jgi:hypothetical protein
MAGLGGSEHCGDSEKWTHAIRMWKGASGRWGQGGVWVDP